MVQKIESNQLSEFLIDSYTMMHSS